MCIFKDEPNGCVALMICIRGAISAEAKAHPYSHAYDQKVLDKETQIALKIIGAPPQVPGVANDQVLADKDALKGLKEVSVEVDETGDQVPGFPDDTELRSTLLKQLSDAGIHVLPPSGKTTTSATLRLNVDTLSYTLGSPPYTTFGIYSARLQFIQLFPAIDPSQSGKSVQAITWTSGNLGIKGGFMVNQVAQEIAGLDSDFVTAYQKANGIAPPQQ
jgi:hypothetical protein